MSSLQQQPWADAPFKLIPTPFGNKNLSVGKAHGSQFIAQQMTHLHNCILRLLNAVYNQAPYVKSPQDIRDFLAFVKHWHDELEHHHMTEEECFFPKLEEAIGQKGIMEGNVEQHRMFEPGLEALGVYATTTSVQDYDGQKLREIIDGFGAILTTHLAEEIDTLLSLNKYDDKALRQTWEDTHKYVLKTCDSYVQLPMLLRSFDSTYENGEAGEIGFPWILYYIVEFWFSHKHRNAWRFLPSTTWGKPKPLAFGPQGAKLSTTEQKA